MMAMELRGLSIYRGLVVQLDLIQLKQDQPHQEQHRTRSGWSLLSPSWTA